MQFARCGASSVGRARSICDCYYFVVVCRFSVCPFSCSILVKRGQMCANRPRNASHHSSGLRVAHRPAARSVRVRCRRDVTVRLAAAFHCTDSDPLQTITTSTSLLYCSSDYKTGGRRYKLTVTHLTVLWIGFCLTGPISLCLGSFSCMYYFVSDCILHACVLCSIATW